MLNKILKKTAIILCLSLLLPYILTTKTEADDISEARSILKKADQARGPWKSFSMNAIIDYEQRGERLKKTFKVHIKDALKTLVAFLTPPKEKGNLLLMVKEDLWFYVKQTQRPMRITPLQRLSGGVSYGDIARLNWSHDYNPKIKGKKRIKIDEKNYDTIELELRARSKSATYHKIALFIQEKNFFPRQADVFLQSGIKMKTLYFVKFDTIHKKPMNSEIVFIDHINNAKITTLKFKNVELKKLPQHYFLKTNMPGISRTAIK